MPDNIVGVQLQVEASQATKTVEDWRDDLRKAQMSADQITKSFGETSKQADFARARIQAIKEQMGSTADQAGKIGDGLTKATAPTTTFRTQMRLAREELIGVQRTFGIISPEAQKAAEKVAGLRFSLEQANKQAELFNPEKKFQSILVVADGMAHGFEAATGAMALFGVKSKDVEETILKVQGAMAFAQGLNGLVAAREDIIRLAGAFKSLSIVQGAYNFILTGSVAGTAATAVATTANTTATVAQTAATVATTTATGAATIAMRVFRTALLLSGIGALVVLLVAAAEHFDIFGTKASAAAEAQKEFNKQVLEGAKEWKDELLASNKAAEELSTSRAKAEGKSEAEITEIKRRAAADRVAILKEYRVSVDKDNKASTAADKAIFEEQTAQQVAEYERQGAVREAAEKTQQEAERKSKAARDKAAAERKTDLAKIDEQEKAFNDKAFAANHSTEETELRAAGLQYASLLALYEKYGKDTINLTADYEARVKAIEEKGAKDKLDKLLEAQQKTVAAAIQEDQENSKRAEQRVADQKETINAIVTAEKVGFDIRRQLLLDFYQSALDQAAQNGQSQVEIERQFTDAKKQLAIEERDTKIKAAQAVSGALDSFAALAGEQTAAGKAFAVASATIQAILGAQQAFTSLSSIPIVGPALGVVAAAGAIAAGLANVKKILAVQIPGTSGGGSAPSLGGTAPIAPSANASQPVQLDQNSINSMGNATIKTFVVESDITGSQQRIKRIQNAAEFK